jgi:NTP pyrophosphatase (non-canonical NTP hydrolase)
MEGRVDDIGLREVQQRREAWASANFPPKHNDDRIMLMVLVEELGELAHARVKGIQQIRHTPVECIDMERDALGDMLISLCGYASARGWDLQEILNVSWEEVKSRTWNKTPRKVLQGKGTTPPPLYAPGEEEPELLDDKTRRGLGLSNHPVDRENG